MTCQKRPPSPGCQGPGTSRACPFCRGIAQQNELLGRLASRQQVVEKAYSREVAQICDGTLAQWNVNYTLSTTAKGSVLTVKVQVHVVDGSGSATADVKGRWQSMVSAVWNNKAQVSVPVQESATSAKVVETITRTVVFELVWADSPSAHAYQVTCNKSLTTKEFIAHFDGLPQTERDGLILWWRQFNPELQNYSTTDPEWKKMKFLDDVPRDATRHGTPHIGEWGDADREAVQHEFGHAIGLPDEYVTTKYWRCEPGATAFTEIALDLAVYNLPPFSSKSLMNNTMSRSGSKIYPRHFDLLAKDFEDLVRTSLAAGKHVADNSGVAQMLS